MEKLYPLSKTVVMLKLDTNVSVTKMGPNAAKRPANAPKVKVIPVKIVQIAKESVTVLMIVMRPKLALTKGIKSTPPL